MLFVDIVCFPVAECDKDGKNLSVALPQVGFKGFHIAKEKQETRVPFLHCGQEYQLAHGSVVIAAVISCTNNCNPSVMLTAGKTTEGFMPNVH